jgi:hypothetical protein
VDSCLDTKHRLELPLSKIEPSRFSDFTMDGDPGNMRRLQTHDIELGVSDVLQRHVTRHVAQAPPVSQKRLDFEHTRPRWFREIIAETIGVFLYGT